ncbi:MAG: alpha/beta hydrolase [Nitrospira sp.]|nr:alpha/beta hydrolase [Nitrospira sp.]HQY58335.1 alpha/beta fold hydrolase [Nitrospira sp.]HRA97008.1 alpha/beta fold hydrolase [Nitrospira sp.]
MPRHNSTSGEGLALVVPGIGNSGPGHWQTLWEQRHPGWQRVQQRDWDRPVCAEWLHGLDAAMARLSAPPVLIAHSMGCLLVAHWAQWASRPVRAALLVAVPDPDGPMFPPAAQGFQPVPAEPLRFPSLVVASSDDPFGSVAYARRCAADWGSDFVEAGTIGHINADSGLGDWPAGLVLLERLLKL